MQSFWLKKAKLNTLKHSVLLVHANKAAKYVHGEK